MVQIYGVIENRDKSLCTILKHPLLCIYEGIAKKDIPIPLESTTIGHVPNWYGPMLFLTILRSCCKNYAKAKDISKNEGS